MGTRKVEEICSEAERELRDIQCTVWRLSKETERHEQWALRYTLDSLNNRLEDLGRELGNIVHVAMRRIEKEASQ